MIIYLQLQPNPKRIGSMVWENNFWPVFSRSSQCVSVGLAAINRGGGLLKSAASAHLQSPFKSLAHTTLYTATAAQQRMHSEQK